MPDASAADRDDRLAGLRRYTHWSLVGGAALAALIPLPDLFGRDLAPPLLLAVLVVLAFVAIEAMRLLSAGLGGLHRRAWATPRAIAATVAGFGLMVGLGFTSDLIALGWTLPFAALVGGLALAAGRRARYLLIAAATLATVTAAGLAALLGATTDDLGFMIPVCGFAVALYGGLTITQVWVWDVTLQVEQARATAAEVAVLRERLRFAADLHDVQGHHLQAIAMKAELARRLIGSDDAAARANAADAQELALTALADTRALVHGYRRVGLATELSNAVAILRAAGVETSVAEDPAPVPTELEPLFGALVREGATNLLRHTDAARCEIAIVREGAELIVRMRDDGVAHATTAAPRADAGAGLDGLRERFAAAGGRLDAGPCAERGFALAGRAPA